MSYHDRQKVEKDAAQARGMFFRELPKMFGYLLFFYAILGVGIPWRLRLAGEVVGDVLLASLRFGAIQGAVTLLAGALLMSAYAARKARYTDFGPAASLTMLHSFRVFAVLGIPLALWDMFRVIVPLTGEAGRNLVQEWWLMLVAFAAVPGWFAGRSIGGLVGLLAIWLSGRRLLVRP